MLVGKEVRKNVRQKRTFLIFHREFKYSSREFTYRHFTSQKSYYIQLKHLCNAI